MRSLGKGVESATTQVKVSSLEIIHITQGQGFHNLETSSDSRIKGECEVTVSGSKSVAGKQTVYIGTWENRIVPNGSFREAEEVSREYGVSVVGQTHSRGVNRVMLIESQLIETLEGVCNLTQGEDFIHAIH